MYVHLQGVRLTLYRVYCTALTGAPATQPQQSDGSYESSSIQTTHQRWEEESTAMDGHLTHLCMGVLKEGIVEHLLNIYEQENKPKDTVAAKTTSEVGQNPSLLSVRHSSDQATPSSPQSSNTVDQLRSSLRQVADALAQTVAAVQNTREQLQNPLSGEEETRSVSQEGGNDDGERESEIQLSEDSEHNPFPPPNVSVPQLPPPPPLPDQNIPPSSCVNLDPASLVLPISEDTLGGEGDAITTPTSLPPLPSHTTLSSVPPLPPPTHSPALNSTTSTTTTVSSFSLPTPLFTQSTSVAQAQPSSTANTTTTSGISVPVASSFDGSQESARAMLEQTDPQDPLYTFLSAYIGAPPPSSGAVGAPSSATSGAPTTQSAPHQSPPVTNAPPPISPPRLPVFTRMQSPSDSHATVGTIPLSQPTMDLTRPPTATYHRLYPTSHLSSLPTPTTTASSSSTAPLSSSQNTDVVSVAENIASQVASFFQSNPLNTLEPSAPPDTLGQAASLASSLAQELSRTVSQITPASSSSEMSGSGLFPQLMPTTSTSLAGQSSPSPSDTLAPLISSLQMPTLPVTSGAEESATTGAVSTPRVADSSGGPTGRQATPLTTPHAGEDTVAEETIRVSVIAGRPWPEVGEIFEQGRVGGREGLLEPASSSSENVNVSLADVENSQSGSSTVNVSTSGEQVPQSSAMEEGATVGTSGVATSSGSGASNIPPTLQQLPDTIDQEFLAALPDHIQQEVLAQHAREQRARQARQEGFTTSISPEFLSALPPNIQEEVSTFCMCAHFVLYCQVPQ